MRTTDDSDRLHHPTGRSSRRRTTGFVLALLTVIALIAALGTAGRAMPTSGWALGRMTPRDRFDTLFNRAMIVGQAGDSAVVAQLASAALASFKRIKRPDADRRFHAAILALHLRDDAEASALADSILTARPGHLLGLMIRVRLAQRNSDSARLSSLIGALLDGHRAELAVGLPEYRDHRAAIDRLLGEIGNGPIPHGAGSPP